MSTDDSSAADRGSALTEGLGLVGWVARNVYPREIPDPSLMIGDDKEEAEYLAGAYNSIYEIIPVYEQSAIDAAVAAERERWRRVAEAARNVTTHCTDRIDYFEVPAYTMAVLSLSLDEGPNV